MTKKRARSERFLEQSSAIFRRALIFEEAAKNALLAFPCLLDIFARFLFHSSSSFRTHHEEHDFVFQSNGFFTPFNLSPPLFVPGKSVNKSRLDKVSSTGLTNGSKQVSNDQINIKAILPRLFEIFV